jgi:hypothetical protein
MATGSRSSGSGNLGSGNLEQPASVGPSENLTPDQEKEILANDTADTSPRAPEPDLSGKRVRAIPAVITRTTGNATTIEVRKSDFASKGIDHPTVVFDERKERFTLPVGKPGGLSEEAAEFLTKNYPTSFEYMGG